MNSTWLAFIFIGGITNETKREINKKTNGSSRYNCWLHEGVCVCVSKWVSM